MPFPALTTCTYRFTLKLDLAATPGRTGGRSNAYPSPRTLPLLFSVHGLRGGRTSRGRWQGRLGNDFSEVSLSHLHPPSKSVAWACRDLSGVGDRQRCARSSAVTGSAIGFFTGQRGVLIEKSNMPLRQRQCRHQGPHPLRAQPMGICMPSVYYDGSVDSGRCIHRTLSGLLPVRRRVDAMPEHSCVRQEFHH